MMQHHALGALRFSIEGGGKVPGCVLDEFAPLRVPASSDDQHIRFRFADELPSIPGASRADPVIVGDDAFAAVHSRLRYHVTRANGAIAVTLQAVAPGQVRRYVPAPLARLTNWNYLTPHETIAKNFTYNVFDYLSQTAQLPLGQTHLHASAFERDGAGVAVIAWGGVGKTSSMLKLVLEDGWSYLSDDLATIDRDGMLWRSPKRLQVYAYNVKNEPDIRRALMAGRGAMDRTAWSLRLALAGPKRVRRRVSAERLFRRAPASRAPLRHAIYIERVETSGFRVRDLAQTELVDRAAAAVMRELNPFTDLSHAMYSTGRHPILPSVTAMYEETRAALAHALRGVQPLALDIPLGAGPTEVADGIRSLITETARAAR